ncbi:sugar ABC transporter substrate-binding protein [Veronia nyctiphanis]|uniref:Probable sugar-binding periplasmic protein n=1 Tax=Veronia nyctiphanis TaxID=1278244 RepID=A0A4Q0YRB5_9GAMM|nr:extracellular solute-binding protein [Veronia nyctiphanis]RXJ73642.1 sugar ABC transporter substrate-binding protein [Veronia nyctiphanis]
MKKYLSLSLLGSVLLNIAAPVMAQTTITVDSWRKDDAIWEQKIIPAFNKHHPEITVVYRSSDDSAQFDSELKSRFENGKAGDLIACRPFDGSLPLFEAGYLKEITEMNGIENFPSFAQAPWQTDSGAQTFCLPMASVIHGFMYNKDIFKKLGVTRPETNDEFFNVLERAKQEGYVPLAMGTKDKWEAATMGFQNIGPNFWKGEDGRFALIEGKERIDSEAYLNTFHHLKRWSKYLGNRYSSRTYADAISLFAEGKAAVYPAGSWDILTFKDKINLGVFKPPVEKRGDACYFSDHTDLGMGLNAKSKNAEAAQIFLEWMTTAEFANILTNEMSGFFSLSNHFFDVSDPIAQEMMSWRDECDSTIRSTAQHLSRMERDIWQTSIGVINKTMSPEMAVSKLYRGVSRWYLPQKNAKKKLTAEECEAL